MFETQGAVDRAVVVAIAALAVTAAVALAGAARTRRR